MRLLAEIAIPPRLDGATRGAPQAQQIADWWHLLHNLSEALEKVLARHHADLKRAFSPEEESPMTAALDQEALARAMVLSQAEQLQQARREQRLATFLRVRELFEQEWSGASIAWMRRSPQKNFCEVRSSRAIDCKRAAIVAANSLASLPFLQTQWAAGEQNIASLYQAIRVKAVRWLGNRCTQLPDSAPQASWTSEEATKILPSRLKGEQAIPTHWSFESSGHLAGFAKTRRLFSGRSAPARPSRASPLSSESGMWISAKARANGP